jgi:hypothetical protein
MLQKNDLYLILANNNMESFLEITGSSTLTKVSPDDAKNIPNSLFRRVIPQQYVNPSQVDLIYPERRTVS